MIATFGGQRRAVLGAAQVGRVAQLGQAAQLKAAQLGAERLATAVARPSARMAQA